MARRSRRLKKPIYFSIMRKIKDEDEVEKITLDEFKKLPRLLPTKSFYPPKVRIPGEPLSLMALEYYDLSLRILAAKVQRRLVTMTDLAENELENIGHAGLEFHTRFAALANLKWRRGRYVASRLRQELLQHVKKSRSEISGRLSEARLKHAHRYSVYSAKYSKMERDIYVRVCGASGLIDSFYSSGKEPGNKFGGSIKSIAQDMVVLYPRVNLLAGLRPSSALLSDGLLDIRYSDLEDSDWEGVDLRLPPEFVNRLLKLKHAESFQTRSCYELIDPVESLDEVILPERTKADIRALCRHFKAQSKRHRKLGLTFLFRGKPGTGKTMTAKAIAHELGLRVYKVNFAAISAGVTPHVVAFFVERARANNSLLLFDECEDMLGWNPYLGLSDGWSKLMFERFNGVAVFTTNFDVPVGFSRRMTYVHDFKNPGVKLRETLLENEFKKLELDRVIAQSPEPAIIADLARSYRIPGGYYRQAIQLAAARSRGARPTPDVLREAFSHCESLIESSENDEVREPTVRLSSVELDASLAENVRNFVLYARDVLGSSVRSSMLPQGATCLFSGPPGTGKTIAAEAVASELGIPFRRVSPSTFLSPYVGMTERTIKEAFRDAQRERYLLFIDEAEGLFLDREGSVRSWEKTQTDELLQQVESYKGVLIIATNHGDMLDAAFARRFLFHMRFEMPSQNTREKLWSQWQGDLCLTQEQLERLACSYELTGGEIRNVAVRAKVTGKLTFKDLLAQCHAEIRHRTGRQSRRMGLGAG